MKTIGETWQEVKETKNENSGNWLTATRVRNDLFILLYSFHCLIDLSKRMCPSNATPLRDYYDLCLTQTLLVSAIPDTAFFLKGYSIHGNDRVSTDAKNKHGDVLKAVESHIRHTRIRTDPKYLETVTVKISLNDVDYLISCVYSASKLNQYRIRPQLIIVLIDLLIAESNKLGCETMLIIVDINFENTNWKQMPSTDYSEALVVVKLFDNQFPTSNNY